MPQDSPKSVVYRSFFSCDGPKGVVECKTSRKSKTLSQKLEDKVEHQRKQKNLDVSFLYNEKRNEMVPERPTDELHNPASIQLMEISKGAQKLNQVINTWSSGVNFDRQSIDIAKDLLRGALDLQESLAMLGKLQEASQYMAKLKKKSKEKANPGKLDGAGIERTTSDRFGYPIRNLEFQSPRLSADGSSRDCFEELREVIKESFARQNLLPKCSTEDKIHFDRRKSSSEEKGYFDRTKSYSEEKTHFDRTKSYSEEKAYSDRLKLDFSLDFPSTSSSQSSVFNSHEFDSFESSLSKSQEEKPKGSNVIAKLMGLEDIPRKSLQPTLQNQFGKDKLLHHGWPVFDIDLPKARRPHFTFQKVDPQRRTLEELIETVQFKGLMTSKSTDRPKHQKHLPNGWDWEKGFANDAPPIVIIKPLLLPVSLMEDLEKQKYSREDLYTDGIIRKWKIKEEVPPQTINDWGGALNLSVINRKSHAEILPLKRPTQEKGDKDCGDGVKRAGDRAIKIQENRSSTRLKASVPMKPKTQKKDVMENKSDKIQNVAPNTRKPTEVTAKSRDTSTTRNPIKLAPSNLKKTGKESNSSKNRASKQKDASSNLTSESSTLTASHTSGIRKKDAKNAKKVRKPPSMPIVESQNKNGDTQTDSGCAEEHALTSTQIIPAEQLPADEVKDSPGNSDNYNNSESSPCDSIKLAVQHKTDTESTGNANSCINFKSTSKEDSEMRNFLLDSSSFLSQAKELFYTNGCQSTASDTPSLNHYGVDDTKLLLDCAKELMEYKSLQCTMAFYRVSQIPIKRSKTFISLDQLVAEISEGIRDLKSYSKHAGQTPTTYTLIEMLKKDIWCKGLVSGSWDLGWRNGFLLDDIEQVIVDIERIVLDGIIDDMLKEFAV